MNRPFELRDLETKKDPKAGGNGGRFSDNPNGAHAPEGYSKQILIGVIVSALLGLSGWTVKKVSDLSVEVAKIEQDDEWVKTILTELSRKN